MRSAAALTLLTVLALTPVAHADLDADVARVHELVEEERWEDGAAAVRKLFADHEGDAAVRGHLKALEEDLKLCLFREQAGALSGEELFGPWCTRLDRHTRTVTLTFPRPERSPWIEQQKLKILPLEFEGTFDLKMTHEFTRMGDNPSLVMLCFDPDADGGYAIVPGTSRVGRTIKWREEHLKFLRVRAGELEEIASKKYDTSGKRGDEVWISRRGSSFTVKIGGKKVLSARDGTYGSGYVALKGVGMRDIEIKGRLEKRFLRRKVGEYYAEYFSDWQAHFYERDKHIPEWLLKDSGDDGPSVDDMRLLPSDAPGGKLGRRLAMIVEEALGGREAPESAKLPEEVEFEPLTQALVDALAALDARNGPRCIERIEQVLAEEPDLAAARVIRGAARYSTREMDGAREDLEFACENAPALPLAHQTLALLDLYEADLPAAAATIRRAVSLGHTDETTRFLETWIVRADRGPQWARRFDHETKHFIVSSDHGKKMCYETATALERMRAKYAKFAGEAPAGTPKSRVYVFAGRTGYLEYAGDLGINLAWTAGVYLPLVRELALWVPEVTADLENTVRHEGFHQYLHIFAENVPPWFNEGMAQVFGELSADDPRAKARSAALRRRSIPVERLFGLTQAEFTAPASVGLHYAQSLRVCRVMRADKKLNAVLETYRDALLAGRAADEAFELLAPAVDEIQKAFDASFE